MIPLTVAVIAVQAAATALVAYKVLSLLRKNLKLDSQLREISSNLIREYQASASAAAELAGASANFRKEVGTLESKLTVRLQSLEDVLSDMGTALALRPRAIAALQSQSAPYRLKQIRFKGIGETTYLRKSFSPQPLSIRIDKQVPANAPVLGMKKGAAEFIFRLPNKN